MIQVSMERLELLVKMELQEDLVNLVQLEQLEKRDRQENQDQLDFREKLAMMDQLVCQELMVHLDNQELLEIPGISVQSDLQELMDNKEKMVNRVE